MKLQLDKLAFHADIAIGWRTWGRGPIAFVAVWDGATLIADVTLDFPDSWSFELCMISIARALDGSQQGELLDPEWKPLWDSLSQYCT